MRTADRLDIPLYMFHDCETSRPSDELLEAIEDRFEYTIGPGYLFEFNIHTEEFYDILSVVDAYNAPILAQLGFRNSEEVIKFLRRYNLSYLIINNAEKTATAQRLKVPAGVYIDYYMAAFRKRDSNAEITKGLETYSQLDKKPYCRKIILPLIVSGALRYSDAEAIGYGMLEDNREVHSLASALSLLPLKGGDGRDYTAEDIKRVLSGKVDQLKEARLRLLMAFGADTAFRVENPQYVSSTIINEEKYHGRRVSPKLALYMDTLHAAMGSPSTPAPIMMIRELYAAKVDAEFAGTCMKENDGVKVTRIIALHEGAASALTEGWL
jgi:hypothetical protein